MRRIVEKPRGRTSRRSQDIGDHFPVAARTINVDNLELHMIMRLICREIPAL